MRQGCFVALAFWLASAGLAMAQAPNHAAPGAALISPIAASESNALAEIPPSAFTTCPAEGDHGNRFWLSADYLLWWIKDSRTPPLVTSGSVADLTPAALGQPGTKLLFGGSIDNQPRSGGRVTAGYWFDPDQTIGFDGGYFFLASRAVRFNAGTPGTPGSPVLGLPFFDLSTHQEQAAVVGVPGVFSPSFDDGRRPENIFVVSSSRLQGAEGNLTMNLFRNGRARLDLFAGYRYLELNEGLGIFALDASVGGSSDTTTFTTSTSTSTSQFCAPNGPAMIVTNSTQVSTKITDITVGDFVIGTNTNINTNTNTNTAINVCKNDPPIATALVDQIDARNQLHTGQIGARGEFAWGNISVGLVSKLALGNNHETVDLKGFWINDNQQIIPGGLFANRGNLGHYSRDRFVVAPEGEIDLSYQLGRVTRVSVGYDFLYLSSVVRPGDQIDRNVNASQAAGNALTGSPQRPFSIHGTDFWAQGINFAIQFRY